VVDGIFRNYTDESFAVEKTITEALLPVFAAFQTLDIPPNFIRFTGEQIIEKVDISTVRCYSIREKKSYSAFFPAIPM
jgi:hypothetical protein